LTNPVLIKTQNCNYSLTNFSEDFYSTAEEAITKNMAAFPTSDDFELFGYFNNDITQLKF